jgi:hypothetical protein
MATTPTYTSPFTGTVVTPTDVSYEALNFSANTTLYWPTTVNSSQTVAARIIDCVASTTGLSIALPDASQGATGTDILFRNLGSNAFTITNNVGGASVTVPVGAAKYFYLTDNTTQAGVWGNVTFGAGTSVADAATLAGLGLTTYNGKLATAQNVIDLTNTPTITQNNSGITYNWKGGAGTITLPNTEDLQPGWYIAFRNGGSGSLNFNTVSGSGQTINGSPSITTNPSDSGFIIYDPTGVGFITVGWALPSAVTFNSASYDVDTIVGNTLNLTSYAPIIQTYIAQSGTRTQTLAVTLPAITQIYVLVNNTNQIGYNITFKCQGSTSTALVLTAGSVLTILSDGTNLYSLVTASTGINYVSNGTSGVPSYSFSSDVTTGLYLRDTGRLGITTGGVELIDVNNNNPSAPVVTVNAALNATIISGGTF